MSVITIFSAIDAELRYSVSPRIVLECAALKAAKLVSADLSAIEERVSRLERKLENGGAFSAQEAPARSAEVTPSPQAESNKPMDARSVWGRLLTYFRLNESSQAFALLNRVTDVEIRGGKLVVWTEPDSFLRLSADDMTEAVTRALNADGAPYSLVVNKKSGGVDMDGEIARIKKMIGDAKLNVKK